MNFSFLIRFQFLIVSSIQCLATAFYCKMLFVDETNDVNENSQCLTRQNRVKGHHPLLSCLFHSHPGDSCFVTGMSKVTAISSNEFNVAMEYHDAISMMLRTFRCQNTGKQRHLSGAKHVRMKVNSRGY